MNVILYLLFQNKCLFIFIQIRMWIAVPKSLSDKTIHTKIWIIRAKIYDILAEYF